MQDLGHSHKPFSSPCVKAILKLRVAGKPWRCSKSCRILGTNRITSSRSSRVFVATLVFLFELETGLCARIRFHIFSRVCTIVRMYVCTPAYVCTCTLYYICTCTYTCIYAHVYVCNLLFACTFACTCSFLHLRMCSHTHTQTFAC